MIRISCQYYPDDLTHPDNDDFKRMRLREISTAISTLRQIIAKVDAKLDGRIIVAQERFFDAQWLKADEKRKLLKQWSVFVKKGFPEKAFVEAIYDHLHLHCSYIAHTSKRGFYGEYWGCSEFHRYAEEFDMGMRPVPLTFGRWESFLEQFSIWGDYMDINASMMAVLREELAAVVKELMAEAQQHLSIDMVRSYELFQQARDNMAERVDKLRREAAELEEEATNLTSEKYTCLIQSKYHEMFGQDLRVESGFTQLALI